MGTTARVGILNKNGSIESIYCSFDGYYSYTGNYLLKHFPTEELIRELLSQGDRRSISGEPYKELGENYVDMVLSKNLDEFQMILEQYNYLFDLNEETPCWKSFSPFRGFVNISNKRCEQ